jgi:hypothetical protein
VPLLPGILHGTVPPGRTEDYQPQGDHSGHAETSTGLPHEFRSHAAPDPDRQRNGDFGKRKDRKTHHEERTGRSQLVRPGWRRKLSR